MPLSIQFRLKPIAVPPPALVNDFGRLINNPDLADVHFRVEDQDVFGHKAVLAIRSEYFRVMLCGGMRESGGVSPGSESANPIELRDIQFDVFLKVLEYLYTDTVRDLSLEAAIHLLVASEQFMLDRLKALCEDCIRREIKLSNVVSILITSHRHNAIGLKDIALDYIIRHMQTEVIMNSLSELKAEPDLLLEIIKRNSAQTGQAVVASGNNGQDNASVGPFGAGVEWDARR